MSRVSTTTFSLLLLVACAPNTESNGQETSEGTLDPTDAPADTSGTSKTTDAADTTDAVDTSGTSGTDDISDTTDATTTTGIPEPDGLDPTGVPGPYHVGYTQSEFDDPLTEDRVLPAHIWYPAAAFDEAAITSYTILDAGVLVLELPSEFVQRDVPASTEGPFPLVVFSHGYGSIAVQSLSLCETLASHGFIVVAADHTGNTTTDDQNGTSVDYDTAAADRPRDVQTIIDSIEAHNLDPSSLLFGIVEDDQVGVTGHSFGGYTAMAAAGGFQTSGAVADPRVKAIAPIAPATDLLSEQDIAPVDVPTLFLAGTLDENTPIDVHVAPPFEAMTAQPRYRVDVEGANHFHFANVCDIAQALIDLGLDPKIWPSIGAGQLVSIYEVTCSAEAFPIDEARRLQNKYVVGFFRAYLASQSDYAALLTPDHADSCEPLVEVWVEGGPPTKSAPCE